MRRARDVVTPFEADLRQNRGYLYTTNRQLSSRYASERLTVAGLNQVELRGARLLDIGCGDGMHTVELFDRAGLQSVSAIDPSQTAIEIARENGGPRAIEFLTHDAYHLPWEADAFDVAYIRSSLHHMERPADAIAEAFRVAPVLLILEPNGYNPVLKILEKVSPYHVAHDEKSYSPHTLDRWVTMAGGEVTHREWIGLVPMFCPDWLARTSKVFEPLIERVPLLNRVLCAQYVLAARRR